MQKPREWDGEHECAEAGGCPLLLLLLSSVSTHALESGKQHFRGLGVDAVTCNTHTMPAPLRTVSPIVALSNTENTPGVHRRVHFSLVGKGIEQV